VTYYTVFVIDLASRRVQIAGSTPFPNELFLGQVSRTLTIADEGLLGQHRVLICDRDRKWSAATSHAWRSARRVRDSVAARPGRHGRGVSSTRQPPCRDVAIKVLPSDVAARAVTDTRALVNVLLNWDSTCRGSADHGRAAPR